MKKSLNLVLLFISFHAFGQSSCYNEFYCLSVDDSTCMSRVTIDTTGGDNIWQFGIAQKSMIDSLHCNTKTFVTDTTLPYPINNHSSFIITNLATNGDVYGFRMFTAEYYVQTDSLNDYGMIEFSLDKGITWIDIINDTTYSNHFGWYSTKPVLTGRSFSCNSFSVDLADLPSIHNFQVGDTILFRFSFISDSIYDNLSGLIFDNICFYDFVEGISETRFKSIYSKIYPNPSERYFTIEFENPDARSFHLAVYDMNSKQLINRDGIKSNKIELDMHDFGPGKYVYKITNLETQKRCWGRFSTLSEK